MRAEVVTKWPLLAYLITAVFNMGLSTACHLCWVKNERVSTLVTYLDYWGIALKFMGCAYTYISFKYACGPFIVWRYIFTSIIAVLTIVAMCASVTKTLMTPGRRTILFLTFCASCLIPIVLLYFWHDPKYTLNPELGDYWWPCGIIFVGTFFYVKRIPEKWSSDGRFDLVGASHQIFHVMILLAIGLIYKFNVELYEERLAF